jgi:hypothetical protein
MVRESENIDVFRERVTRVAARRSRKGEVERARAARCYRVARARRGSNAVRRSFVRKEDAERWATEQMRAKQLGGIITVSKLTVDE